MSNWVRKNDGGMLHSPFFGRRFENDFFSDFFNQYLPAVNEKEEKEDKEDKKEFKLEISMPGFDKKDIEIKVDKNIISISVKKDSGKEKKGEDDKILRHEFSSLSFY